MKMHFELLFCSGHQKRLRHLMHAQRLTVSCRFQTIVIVHGVSTALAIIKLPDNLLHGLS